jgi:uncharacterized protein
VSKNGSPARGKPTRTEAAQRSSQAVSVVSGSGFHDLLNAGLAWLDQHHEIVNALNVFPVPDGDTGTNMLLTMRSACQEVKAETAHSVGEVARTAAHGALMGARGNSGVILSQILRGMARRLDNETTLTGPRFAAALSEGSRIAYKGVNRPVEGTILTVVREAADAAEKAAALNPDLSFVIERTLRAADESVINTPKLLPVLAQAGKVDSGGKGLYFILEGMYRALTGQSAATVTEVTAPIPAPAVTPRPAKGRRELPPVVYGFDVQFLVEGHDLDVDAIRRRIVAMGEHGLVEGDKRLVKVHVHAQNPGPVLSYAVSLGFITDVIVENMDDKSIATVPEDHDLVPSQSHAAEAVPELAEMPMAGLEPSPVEGPGIVVVAPGAGLAQVFKSLGAHVVISGGQTMNPSTQQLLQAVQGLENQEVIILPNNSNIIMTAQQAQALASIAYGTEPTKRVVVVPSKTIPQGISALLALNPSVDLARNMQAMTAALSHVKTGAVTVAVQDAQLNGFKVHAGDVIGLLDDELTATEEDSSSVVKKLLEQMDAADMEIITLYYGLPVTAEDAEELREELRELYPDQEIELVNGGQPFYHYIVSAE